MFRGIMILWFYPKMCSLFITDTYMIQTCVSPLSIIETKSYIF